ncbi:zinc-finger-containing protein [Enterovibrio sp. 27052020O]|uniref:zinc-finger-containing protein n=1 Tax=Enterovibrio sp. 27052020O TaxID=3241166 RepID=UPI00388E576F
MTEVKTPWNPSKKATARVKNPLPAPTECRYCTGEVSAVKNSAIYGREYGEWPWLYLCTGCRAYVGMHPFTNIPLGTLANQMTRDARKEHKPTFERLFESNLMTRNEAYTALASKLGIEKEECHFGWFDAPMCEAAAQASREIYLDQMSKR